MVQGKAMTVEELRQEMKADMARIAVSLEAMGGRMTTVATDVAAIAAKLDGTHDRHSEEIGTLFDLHKGLSERVQAIEVRYVPRDEHQRESEANKGEHTEFRTAIGALQVNVGKLVALAALIGGGTGVAGMVAKALLGH